MATFESMDRRMPKIEACLKANGLESLDACNEMLLAKGIDCDKIVRGVQPICFDNAVWAYTLGTAIAVKRGLTDACLLYTSPSPRDMRRSRMPSSA